MSGDPQGPEATLAEQWDARYRKAPDLWTHEPNALLAQFAAPLQPGRAVDVGAGDGRNAIWLATHGWGVTAIDVSAVALERASQRADARGARLECVVADWRDHPLGEASLELVVVSFMHPQPGDRDALFGRAARALVAGGHLFTVGVALADHGRRGPPDADRLYTPQRLRDSLHGLDVVRCEEHSYEQHDSSGRRTVTDVVAIARRPRASY